MNYIFILYNLNFFGKRYINKFKYDRLRDIQQVIKAGEREYSGSPENEYAGLLNMAHCYEMLHCEMDAFLALVLRDNNDEMKLDYKGDEDHTILVDDYLI